jgi:Zn-dependent protease with chaperone function
VVTALTGAAIPAVFVGGAFHAVLVGLAVWALFSATLLGVYLCPFPFEASLSQVRVERRPAVEWVQEKARSVAVALGQAPVPVVEINHASLNVGLVGVAGDRTLVVTSGVLEQLTPSEVEALLAARLSIGASTAVTRLMRAVSWASLARWSPLVAFLLAPLMIVVPQVLTLAFIGLPVWLLGSRLRWWLNVAFDAACVATTRYPEPLASALCKVALYNGPRIPVTYTTNFGLVDFAWTAPVSVNYTSITRINDRTVRVSTSEMEADLRLLLGAQLVTDVCVHGRPLTFNSWKAASAVVVEAEKEMAAGAEFVRVGNFVVSLQGVTRA